MAENKGYTIGLAKSRDDKPIRDLLKNNPMPGPISLSFEREPSFFGSLFLQGHFNQVIIAKDEAGEAVGVGTRSIQKVFINRHLTNVGYLSNLRIDKKHRGKGILNLGMNFLKSLDSDNKADYYYMTITSQNDVARKIFEGKKKGFPNAANLSGVVTYIIPFDQAKIGLIPIDIRKGKKQDEKRIIDFIKKEGAKQNFFPALEKDELSGQFGLKITDFLILENGGEIEAVACLTDQSRLKQNVVKGYGSYLFFIKPLYNLIAPLIRRKKLPEINEHFKCLYLSYFAGKDSKSKEALIEYALKTKADSDYHFLILSLHNNDKMNEIMKNIRSLRYESIFYALSWKKRISFLSKLKDKDLYIEAAKL